jgi:hypothetical protein
VNAGWALLALALSVPASTWFFYMDYKNRKEAMTPRVNRYYKIELIVRDSSDDTDAIAEDITHLLGGYDIYEFDIYEVRH